jgi:hypothetical protein
MSVVVPNRSQLVPVPPQRRDTRRDDPRADGAGGDDGGAGGLAGTAARQGLPMRFPIRHSLPRRRRWWRKFMSPVWLVLAAPALVLPLLVMILMDDGPAPSMVEQAITALPIPGDASDPEQGRTGRVAVMGASGGALPASMSARLYSNSARADAARLAQRPEPRNEVVPFPITAYGLLHPRSLAGEDMMVGDFILLIRTPVPDLSWAIFAAYCSSDGSARGSLADLPINPALPAAIVNFLTPADYGKLCPRLG